VKKLKLPTGDQITTATDMTGLFMKGVAYNTTWTSSQRTFSDLMRSTPVGAPERLGRAISGLALAVTAAITESRKK